MTASCWNFKIPETSGGRVFESRSGHRIGGSGHVPEPLKATHFFYFILFLILQKKEYTLAMMDANHCQSVLSEII